jgi:hypothetical protein
LTGRCDVNPAGAVVSLNFNVPADVFVNQVTEITDTPITADSEWDSSESGYPAKNRGLWFNGTGSAYVLINGFVLNHSFTIHTWILLKDNSDVMPIFELDNEDTSTGLNAQRFSF